MESNAFTKLSDFFIAVFRYDETDYKIRVKHSKFPDRDHFEIECSDGNHYQFECRKPGTEPRCLTIHTESDTEFLSEMASVLIV